MTMTATKLFVIVLILRSISHCVGNQQGCDFPPRSNCTFNRNTKCAWIQGKRNDDNFDWSFTTSPEDNVIFMEASKPHGANETAWFISPFINCTSVCFSFRYHMFGVHVNALNVRLRTSTDTTLIWRRTRSQDNIWIRGYRSIKENRPFQIILEGVAGEAKDNTNTNGGAIAVDDLQIRHGHCVPSLEFADSRCDFEEHYCKWEVSDTKFPWSRSTSLDLGSKKKPAFDHTTRTDNGHFLSVTTDDKTINAFGILESAYLSNCTTSSQCFQFWYYVRKSSNASLTVLLSTGTSKQKLLNRRGVKENGWSFAQVTVPCNRNHKIIVKGSIVNDPETVVAIDDTYILDEACDPPGFCTFQHGLCGWRNKFDNNNVIWQRSTGGVSVIHTPNMPRYDATLTDSGYFLFIDISNTKESVEGILTSEPIESCPNNCFMFMYNTHGEHFGILEVILRHNGKENQLIRISRQTHHRWIQRNIDIITSCDVRSFEIIIKATAGSSGGYVAIDNLYLLEGRCPNATDTIVIPPDPATPSPIQTPVDVSGTHPSTSPLTNPTDSTIHPINNSTTTKFPVTSTTVSLSTTILPRKGCTAGKVNCGDRDSTCVFALYLCDGVVDCPNRADEISCDASFVSQCYKNADGQPWFYCETKNGPKCLSANRVCNNKSDCLNIADETSDFCSGCPFDYCRYGQCNPLLKFPQCMCFGRKEIQKPGYRRCVDIEDAPAPTKDNSNDNLVLISIPFLACLMVIIIILFINIYCHYKYRWYQAAGIFQNRNTMYTRNSMSEITEGITNPTAESEDESRPRHDITSILGSPLADLRNSTVYYGAIIVDDRGNLISVPSI